jgi:hypothetical protein
MQTGEQKTIGPIPPAEAFGVTIKEGDIISVNLSEFGIPQEIQLSVYKIKEDQTPPPEYGLIGNTTMYVLRDVSHNVGDIITYINNTVAYLGWENSTIITEVGNTEITMYTTPTTAVDESFTWIVEETDGQIAAKTTFPEDSSSISVLNDTTIVVDHNPQVGDNITVTSLWIAYGYETTSAFTVVSLTDDKINTSYPADAEGTTLEYQEFDRQTTIQRDSSQNITSEAPESVLEENLLSLIRSIDDDFIYSISPHADQTVYFEIEVVQVYKTSQES